MLRRMPKVETSSTWLLRPGHILQQRSLHIPPFLLPPVIFTGLLVTLWCWKCTMLVLLQNTIIYNPYLPPNARKLKISDYARQCRGIKWRQESLQSLDGTGIALCVSQIDSVATKPTAKPFDGAKTPVYIMYFQGWFWIVCLRYLQMTFLIFHSRVQVMRRLFLHDCLTSLRFYAGFNSKMMRSTVP